MDFENWQLVQEGKYMYDRRNLLVSKARIFIWDRCSPAGTRRPSWIFSKLWLKISQEPDSRSSWNLIFGNRLVGPTDPPSLMQFCSVVFAGAIHNIIKNPRWLACVIGPHPHHRGTIWAWFENRLTNTLCTFVVCTPLLPCPKAYVVAISLASSSIHPSFPLWPCHSAILDFHKLFLKFRPLFWLVIHRRVDDMHSH